MITQVKYMKIIIIEIMEKILKHNIQPYFISRLKFKERSLNYVDNIILFN